MNFPRSKLFRKAVVRVATNRGMVREKWKWFVETRTRVTGDTNQGNGTNVWGGKQMSTILNLFILTEPINILKLQYGPDAWEDDPSSPNIRRFKR